MAQKSHKKLIKGKMMKYLLWKKRVQGYIESEFDEHFDWESWCDWKEYFIQGYSPQNAVKDARTAS